MKTVGFLLDDSGFTNVDCSSPEFGNPGIGGTQYCFIALAKILSDAGIPTMLINLNSSNKFPGDIANVTIDDFHKKAAKAVHDNNAGVLIIRAEKYRAMDKLLRGLDPQTKVLAWSHNHLDWHDLQKIGADPRIKKVVFVGNEQHALACDTLSRYKGITIHNPFFPPAVDFTKTKKLHNSVVYVGSLIPSKGFHRLAKIWPQIRKQVPDARLEVIGSGTLYNRNSNVGPLGIADNNYEKKILNYIKVPPDKLGIKFHGLLKRERFHLISCCQVGVPNPTGLTECFPGSILEMSACSLPIATVRRWGACDTVGDNTTGLLADNEVHLTQNIIKLLRNKKLSQRLGEQGRKWVQNNFPLNDVANKWIKLFNSLGNGTSKNSTMENKIKIKGNYWWSPLYSLRSTPTSFAGHLRTICSKIESWKLKH